MHPNGMEKRLSTFWVVSAKKVCPALTVNGTIYLMTKLQQLPPYLLLTPQVEKLSPSLELAFLTSPSSSGARSDIFVPVGMRDGLQVFCDGAELEPSGYGLDGATGVLRVACGAAGEHQLELRAG